MSTDPKGWLDRLVSVCISLFIGALALYVAVQLIEAVWLTLVIVGAIMLVAAGLIALRNYRTRGW